MLEGDAEGEGAAKPPSEPRVSTTDAEAQVMKMPDGGFRPAFNRGLAKLRPMSERLAAAYGRRPGEHLVDGGFAELAFVGDFILG